MARSFSLSASIMPTVDERAAEREGEQLAQTFEESIGGLSPEMDDGMGGIGGVRAGGGGGMGGGGGGGAGLLGGALRGGGMASVALAGATAFGILKATQEMARASPLLESVLGHFGDAMSLFFRPFGDFLGTLFRPMARGMLNFAVDFNENVGPALTDVADFVLGTFSGTINTISTTMDILADVFTGDFTSLQGLLVDLLPEFSWPSLPEFSWPSLPEFSWPGLPEFSWPSSSDILGLFSMPAADDVLGLFDLPSANDVLGLFNLPSAWSIVNAFNFPTANDLLDSFSMPTPSMILELFPSINDVGKVLGSIFGGFAITKADVLARLFSGPPTEDDGNNGFNAFPIGPFLPNLPSLVPTTAQGGIARRPQTRMVGEAGPEAVMPLDDLSREISRAIRQALQGADTGGGRGGMQAVQSELQTVVEELRRTRQAINDQEVTVEQTDTSEYDPF